MVALLGLTVVSFLVSALVDFQFRSAYHGLLLSNGVEVLVSAEVSGRIERDYTASAERNEEKRWDDAILNALRHDRPREWTYLIQSLAFSKAALTLGPRRTRQTLNV